MPPLERRLLPDLVRRSGQVLSHAHPVPARSGVSEVEPPGHDPVADALGALVPTVGPASAEVPVVAARPDVTDSTDVPPSARWSKLRRTTGRCGRRGRRGEQAEHRGGARPPLRPLRRRRAGRQYLTAAGSLLPAHCCRLDRVLDRPSGASTAGRRLHGHAAVGAEPVTTAGRPAPRRHRRLRRRDRGPAGPAAAGRRPRRSLAGAAALLVTGERLRAGSRVTCSVTAPTSSGRRPAPRLGRGRPVLRRCNPSPRESRAGSRCAVR